MNMYAEVMKLKSAMNMYAEVMKLKVSYEHSCRGIMLKKLHVFYYTVYMYMRSQNIQPGK